MWNVLIFTRLPRVYAHVLNCLLR